MCEILNERASERASELPMPCLARHTCSHQAEPFPHTNRPNANNSSAKCEPKAVVVVVACCFGPITRTFAFGLGCRFFRMVVVVLCFVCCWLSMVELGIVGAWLVELAERGRPRARPRRLAFFRAVSGDFARQVISPTLGLSSSHTQKQQRSLGRSTHTSKKAFEGTHTQSLSKGHSRYKQQHSTQQPSQSQSQTASQVVRAVTHSRTLALADSLTHLLICLLVALGF